MHKSSAHQLCNISIDVETDWGGRCPPLKKSLTGCYEVLPKLLELFSQHQIKATFFISTEIAYLIQDLILKIIQDGHEIASHGHHHNIRYDQLTKSALKDNIKQSKEILEEIINRNIYGFRTPQFRIHPHLFDVLEELQFFYDSSYVAGNLKGRYQNRISKDPFKKQNIWEIPMLVTEKLGIPNGLLWINALSPRLFSLLKDFEQEKFERLYLHPFDLAKKNYNKNYNWKINTWYLFKQSKPFNSLEWYIMQNGDKNFQTMYDIATSYYN